MPRTSFASGAMPGIMKAIGGMAKGGQDEKYLHDMVKMDVAGSQIQHAAAASQAALAQARQHDAEASILEGRPGLYEEQVAMQAGSDIPTVQAIRKMVAGDPSMQMGPPTEGGQMGRVGLPVDAKTQAGIVTALQRLAPMAFNKRDITPESLAKASGLYADQDREANALGGGMSASEMENWRRYRLADKGGDRYSANPEGVLDQFGGALDVSAPSTQAEIGRRRASAAASSAAARHSDALTTKTKVETAALENPNEGFSPAAIENAAYRYNLDGTLPPMGMGKAGSAGRQAILNRAAELSMGTNGTDLRLGQMDAKAASQALGQLAKTKTMTAAFEQTANNNADIALDLSKKLDRTGSPLLNTGLQAWRTGTGSPEATQFAAANETFVAEYAKIMSGGMGNSPVSDAARKKASDLLTTSMSPKQYEGNVRLLQREMQNRMKGFEDQETALRDRLRGSGGGGHAALAPAPAAPAGWSYLGKE